MTEREKKFFDRKLANTSGEAHEKVIHTLVKRFIDEYVEKAKKKERNEYYKATNFGL